jgi:hypothetical protein
MVYNGVTVAPKVGKGRLRRWRQKFKLDTESMLYVRCTNNNATDCLAHVEVRAARGFILLADGTSLWTSAEERLGGLSATISRTEVFAVPIAFQDYPGSPPRPRKEKIEIAIFVRQHERQNHERIGTYGHEICIL